MRHGVDAVFTLRAAGTSLVVDTAGPVPRVLHWGADLGPIADEGLRATSVPAVLNNAPDEPRTLTVWPSERDGWSGTPAQEGHAAGGATTPRPELVAAECDPDEAGGGRLRLAFTDPLCGMRGEIAFALDPFGVLTVDRSLTRDDLAPGVEAAPYALGALRTLMPLPDRAAELLDFSGKWCRERAPQRGAIRFGTHLRRAHRGKPGHDTPYLMAAGTRGFGFGHGEVWAAHLAWSGESEYFVERLPEGAGAFNAVLGVGEALHPGEVLLAAGERYDAPTAVFTWSDAGLDGIADRLHRRQRARPSHPAGPRPLVLNTWEAVYFDHDLERLTALVESAAKVGVERIVLDDGWFRGRRGDRAGLGDWYVDAAVWPRGLGPFVDLVRARGMEFGLWFEPEMVNLDSDLARAHPDWVLGPARGLGPSARHQYVLDIARPEAYAYVLERISSTVSEYGIDYLKWDHNRDLLEAVGRADGTERPAVRVQTLALYRLLDELRERHPGLEIETCSGGGGRIDLGILDHTDRLWATDCNDPVERAQIERWTRMLVPPELIGSHLGAARSHTTSRTTDLPFRLAASLTAHAGIEMDLSIATAAELEAVRAWADLYKELRGLVHTGRVVNADLADEATALSGVVAQDGSQAVYVWARTATSPAGQSGRVRLPGLDPAARYRVRVREEIGAASRHQNTDPAWLAGAAADGIVLDGAVLALAGVPLPTLNPQQAMLLDLRRTL
ncbi:alpha-galactosidase [Glycomyces harbinensis]|uniref:alpha-galactosidase n=1 Tax=Glycomyces harbinensis TaxID=58114 RepID=A0A1G7ACW6_9ACTN|nr:alpha-galactosidase [Glycomyces harbinensis]SDE12662.1 alpha-galactosidase [Glycomyces harbinensis]